MTNIISISQLFSVVNHMTYHLLITSCIYGICKKPVPQVFPNFAVQMTMQGRNNREIKRGDVGIAHYTVERNTADL